MKVKMFRNAKGSENGITLKEFKAGEVYDIIPNLAEAFVVHMKVAEYYTEPIEIPEPMKFEIPEKSYKVITLKDKPRKWVGMEIRDKDSGTILTVKDVIRGGTVVMSDDRHLAYGTIRKQWEIV